MPRCVFPNEISGNKVYHETLRPPPEGGEDGFIVEALPGDGNPAVISARFEAYRRRCDSVVRSFAVVEGAREAEGEDSAGKRGARGSNNVALLSFLPY